MLTFEHAADPSALASNADQGPRRVRHGAQQEQSAPARRVADRGRFNPMPKWMSLVSRTVSPMVKRLPYSLTISAL